MVGRKETRPRHSHQQPRLLPEANDRPRTGHRSAGSVPVCSRTRSKTPECKSMYRARRQEGVSSLTSWNCPSLSKGFNTTESQLRGYHYLCNLWMVFFFFF